MKQKFTFLLAMLFTATLLNAQWTQNTADIKKSDAVITLDGDASDWPTNLVKHDIERDFTDETPAFDTDPTWAAFWNDTALYVLVEYADDDWVPVFDPAWKADKIEVVIDVNATLEDGVGASSQGNGHYQVSPGYIEDNAGVEGTHSIGYFADSYNEGAVVREVRIPFSKALDVDGNAFEVAIDKVIGFDITVADNDESNRQRKVWCNFGEVGENWNNMDQAGAVTFVAADEVGVNTNNAAAFNVYPNPTTGTVSFEGSYDFVELYDLTGKLVKTYSNVSNTLEINDVTNGLYILNFDGKENATVIKK